MITVIERLKLELSNKTYFTDTEYTTFLAENQLLPTDTYNKATMQKSLLYTVVDILEAVSNNVDLLRRVETEFETTDAAHKHLQSRITDIKKRISTIPDSVEPENNSPFSLMFTKGR